MRRIELTQAELDALPAGTALHFTNWPGTPSKPVTLLKDCEDGNIQFASGKRMHAFADELSTEPRAGLEVTEVADATSESFRCPCCGVDVLGIRPVCYDCADVGCQMTRDGAGELNWWRCQRQEAVWMGTYITVVPSLVKVRHTSRGWRLAVGPRWLRLHVGAGGPGVSTGAGPVSWYRPLRRKRRWS